jgi:para-nitrobenzyl esterase
MRATWDSIRAGDNLKVPLLAGTNADEWLDSVAQNPTREDVTLQASQLKHIDAGRALAAVADEPDQRQALERIVTADEMLCPTQYALARTSELGGKAWMYFFTRVREGQAGKQVGAFHGAEYTYIFGTNYAGMPVTATDEALRAAMTSYWLAFARHGNPNATDLPDWPNYGAPDYRVQEFGDEVRTIARPEAALCESFDARHAGE